MATEGKILEARFDDAVKRWRDYIANGRDSRGMQVLISSRSASAVECDAYREIVDMGSGALPLIRRLYDEERKSDDTERKDIVSGVLRSSLTLAVKDIMGEAFEVPEGIRGKVDEMERHTKEQLDIILRRY